MFGRTKKKRMPKCPIVRFFAFLESEFGMELVDYNPYGYSWSRWSNGKKDLVIYNTYGDEPPFTVFVYPPGEDGSFYERRLVPPNCPTGYPEEYEAVAEWLRNELRSSNHLG